MAGLIFPSELYAQPKTHIINMNSDPDGAKVWFDPIGLFIQPGERIRWVIKNNVHTVCAYHPDNDNHSLRIPKNALPWNSGYLVEPGEIFEAVLNVPGVYDYYCEPHEEAGMVGRIVVGKISGPGARPFNYFEKMQPQWEPVPMNAQQALPSAEEISRKKIIRRLSE